MIKKNFLIFSLLFFTQTANALVINELFSNPVGDDSGREWIEIYNETDTQVDISSLSISVKGGNPIIATPVSGGVTVPPYGYAVIGSTVSGATRFLQDYPEYNGILFKSSISLVNTGITSIDIRLGGVVVDTISSYTAAKEGKSYAKINSQFITAIPSPGKENIGDEGASSNDTQATTTGTAGAQTTIPQMSPPSADITLYLPFERTVVAGAPTLFSVYALTGGGKSIDAINYSWSFGDGGQGVGSTTLYRYLYPGMYVVYVDGTTGNIAGKARMKVKVVNPDITLSHIKESKFGSYIEITNPNQYELDISGWKLSIDGAMFSFPFTTTLLPGKTIISSQALGFASTAYTSSSTVKLLFGDNTEVTRAEYVASESIQKNAEMVLGVSTAKKIDSVGKKVHELSTKTIQKNSKISSSSTLYHATTTQLNKRDNRIALFFRSLLGR